MLDLAVNSSEPSLTPIIPPGSILVKGPAADLLALGWVDWKPELRDGKLTKIPKDPRTDRNAAVDNPATWSPYPDAVEACARRGHAGVGPVLTAEAGFTCIDLDGCRDPETGIIEALALQVAARFHSLTEISQSGRGLHIWIKATIPGPRRRSGHVEMYDRGRWIAWTGNLLPGFPTTLENRQSELDVFYSEQFPEPEPTPAAPRIAGPTPDLSDEALVAKMLASANGSGAKIRRLLAGNTSDYGDNHSSADQGLSNYLVWWTNGDLDRADRIFRTTGLMRPKWDRALKGSTYGRVTLETALADCRGGYTGTADPALIVHHGATEEVTPILGVTPDSCDTRLVLACLTLMGRVAELERTAKLREVEIKIARNPEVKTVAPAVRVAAFAYSHAVDTGKLQRGEPYKIYLPDLAVTLGKGGLCPNGKPDAEAVKAGGAIGAHLKQYALTANLEYKSEKPRDPTTGAIVGPTRSYITFAGGDVFDDLGKLAEVRDLPTMTDSTGRQKAKWGGKRYPCPVCGSLNTKHLCLDCGNVFTEADYPQDGGNSTEPDATSDLLSSSVVVLPCENFGVTPESDVAEDPTPILGVASDDLPTCSECPAPATIKRANGKPYCGAHGWWVATEPDVGPRQAYFDAAGGGG